MSVRTTSLALASVALFSLAGASLAACAGNTEAPLDDPALKTDSGAATDAKPTTTGDAAKLDSGTAPDTAAKDTCAPTCTTDDQCKNSCTVPTSGSYCCDKSLSKCYKYTANVCPAPVDPPDSAPPPTTSP